MADCFCITSIKKRWNTSCFSFNHNEFIHLFIHSFLCLPCLCSKCPIRYLCPGWIHTYIHQPHGVSVAAVTNYHKHRALNHLECILSQSGGHRSKTSFTGLKSRCRQDCGPQGTEGASAAAPSNSWWQPAFLGLWLHHANVHLRGHMACSSSSMTISSTCLL